MAKGKNGNRHALMGILLLIVITVGIYAYFKYDMYYPSTDDAYVGANLVNVAPKVNGYLVELNVKNDQLVKKGDLLFKLNTSDYDLSYQNAQKNYASYQAQVAMAEKQLDIQKGVLAKDQSQYDLALLTLKRYKALYGANTLSKQAYQTATTNLANAMTQIEVDKNKYAQYVSMNQFANAKLDQAKVNVDSANLNLSYTSYYAPCDGYITNLSSLSIGEFISSGQQLFGIVNTANWWVDANFKETQLARIRNGEIAEVRLDMYDHKYQGVVQSISFASGNTFSLLPAQNATGNWVKVTQRFTVRIALKNDPNFPLRVGASSYVKIKTIN